MKITFGAAFDGGAWPGALGDCDAVAGETWVGPLGLLDTLETAGGLAGPFVTSTERSARLVERVQETDGFWSASARIDARATAQRLLAWRDDLVLHGWDPEEGPGAMPPRLAALAEVTAGSEPGFPDRLVALEDTLLRHGVEIEQIALVDRRSELAPRWRSVLDALGQGGTRVIERDSDAISADTGSLLPGAGSLQLVCPHGPLEAADELAAALAARPSPAGTVVIGADEVLEDALRQHGLPTLGVRAAGEENVLLALLPMVIELALDPIDPQLALELLLVPNGPVPGGLARRLVEALHEQASLRGSAWREALQQGIARIEDEGRRARVGDRIAWLFRPELPRGEIVAGEVLERRVALLIDWLGGRMAVKRGGTEVGQALSQLEAFRSLVRSTGRESFTWTQVQRLVGCATDTVGVQRHAAEAGFVGLRSPGAIVSTVSRVVWWNFTQQSAPAVARRPWTVAEQAALGAAGVELPSPADEARRMVRRWRRPWLHARDELILISPQRGADGERCHPHPLWDEIVCGMQDEEQRALIGARVMGDRAAPRRRRMLRDPSAARREWVIPAGALSARDVESPSSVSKLVGCPFAYSVQYTGKCYSGNVSALAEPGTALVKGSLAHEVLARVFSEGTCSPSHAEERATRTFHELVEEQYAALALARHDMLRAELEHKIRQAAGAVAQVLEGRRILGVEVERSVPALGRKLQGRLDLALEEPLAVVDYKWGGMTRRRRELEKNVAVQLACYAHMLGASGGKVGVAYLILSGQTWLTSDSEVFPDVPRVGDFDARRTWAGLETAWGRRWKSLGQGVVEASGVEGDDGEGVILKDDWVDDELRLAAPCRYCDHDALCGRRFGESS